MGGVLESAQRRMSNPYHTQVGGDHYRDHPVQLAEFLNRNDVPWAVGEVMTHVFRYRAKGGVEDLRKAAHYIEMLIYEESINYDNRSGSGSRPTGQRSGRETTTGSDDGGWAPNARLWHEPV